MPLSVQAEFLSTARRSRSEHFSAWCYSADVEIPYPVHRRDTREPGLRLRIRATRKRKVERNLSTDYILKTKQHGGYFEDWAKPTARTDEFCGDTERMRTSRGCRIRFDLARRAPQPSCLVSRAAHWTGRGREPYTLDPVGDRGSIASAVSPGKGRRGRSNG